MKKEKKKKINWRYEAEIKIKLSPLKYSRDFISAGITKESWTGSSYPNDGSAKN